MQVLNSSCHVCDDDAFQHQLQPVQDYYLHPLVPLMPLRHSKPRAYQKFMRQLTKLARRASFFDDVSNKQVQIQSRQVLPGLDLPIHLPSFALHHAI